MPNNKLNLIETIDEFAQKLMIISEKLPPEFYFSLGLSKELIDLYRNEMDKEFAGIVTYLSNKEDKPIKALLYNNVYRPTMGHLRIKEFNNKS